MSRENLEKILNQANACDWHVAERAWFRYHSIVSGIARRYNSTVSAAAGVFSALSPNNDYLGNVRDTARVLAAACAGTGIDSFKVSTYGANKRKAWRIANGEDPLTLIVSAKTRNFYLNVLDPTDPRPVTVDGHIFNAWRGQRINLNEVAMKSNARHYDEVAEDIRQIAAQRGIISNVVQGSIWFCWKRIHGIKPSTQLELWATDMALAGLGFQREHGVG